MAYSSFILKEPHSKNETLIYFLFRFNSVKLKYSTTQKVLPKYWNPEKQRIREQRNFSQHTSINLLNLEDPLDCLRNLDPDWENDI
jgi:hypothetical protein